jgi:hypothetical protein
MSSFLDILTRWKQALTPLPTITDADEEYREILDAAGQEAEEQLDAAGVPRQIGWTETFLDTKKFILRKKYGLKWKPPKS